MIASNPDSEPRPQGAVNPQTLPSPHPAPPQHTAPPPQYSSGSTANQYFHDEPPVFSPARPTPAHSNSGWRKSFMTLSGVRAEHRSITPAQTISRQRRSMR